MKYHEHDCYFLIVFCHCPWQWASYPVHESTTVAVSHTPSFEHPLNHPVAWGSYALVCCFNMFQPHPSSKNCACKGPKGQLISNRRFNRNNTRKHKKTTNCQHPPTKETMCSPSALPIFSIHTLRPPENLPQVPQIAELILSPGRQGLPVDSKRPVLGHCYGLFLAMANVNNLEACFSLFFHIGSLLHLGGRWANWKWHEHCSWETYDIPMSFSSLCSSTFLPPSTCHWDDDRWD